KVETLDNKVEILDNKFVDLDNKVGTLDNKVVDLGNKVETLDNKFVDLDNKVVVLDGKFSTLDNKVDTIKQELIDRMEKMEADILNTCLGYTDDRNEIIMKKLDNIQSTVNTLTRMETIDNDVYKLVNKRIDELAERVECLEHVS
uniref:hypothetical protein n=1 Tax=Faecalicatena orotica TaxID=1544 RepID=UPI003217F6CB